MAKAHRKKAGAGIEMTTAEAVVGALLAHGLDTVYALPGVHNDDFFDALHVYRALTDYCAAYIRQYKLLARTHELGQVAIVML